MQTQTLRKFAALAIAFAATHATAHETGTKPSAEELRNWSSFVTEFMPVNLINDDSAMQALLQPIIGEPFSRNFSALRAQTVFVDKVAPAQNCFVDVLPDGVLPQEECDNKGQGSIMSVNMDDGALKYMNINREPNFADTDGVRLTREIATRALADMAIELGVPGEELGLDFVNVKPLIAAATRRDLAVPDERVSKNMD
ncbi:hypothetical protein GYB62_01775 [bacterium]|nr:hypothetical protein [bacterium]